MAWRGTTTQPPFLTATLSVINKATLSLCASTRWFARYVTMQNQPTTSDWAEQHEGQWWVWRDVATLRHTIICPLKYILRHQQSVAATDACVHVPYTCRAFAVDYPSSGCTHLRKSLTGTVYVRASPFTYCWTFFFFFFFFFSLLSSSLTPR